MEPGIWYVGDEQILVDTSTEIHGTPAVGARMTCIGEDLPGERMKALEVWILPAPGAPTVLPRPESLGTFNSPLSVRT